MHFTAFTEGEQNFSGPTLKSLLAARTLERKAVMLQATAIDDYGLDDPGFRCGANTRLYWR